MQYQETFNKQILVIKDGEMVGRVIPPYTPTQKWIAESIYRAAAQFPSKGLAIEYIELIAIKVDSFGTLSQSNNTLFAPA